MLFCSVRGVGLSELYFSDFFRSNVVPRAQAMPASGTDGTGGIPGHEDIGWKAAFETLKTRLTS